MISMKPFLSLYYLLVLPILFVLHRSVIIYPFEDQTRSLIYMTTFLSQKPKRTLSNLSYKELQNAKQICRNSFEQYKQKFSYEPDWNNYHKIHQPKTKYQLKKQSQASKFVLSRHTYTVQANRVRQNSQSKQDPSKAHLKQRKRPSTASYLTKTPLKSIKENQIKDVSTLFQNQHLSSTLQESELMQKQRKFQQMKNYGPKSRSISVNVKKSFSSNSFSVKYGKFQMAKQCQIPNDDSKEDNNHKIRSILSIKDNFYNPYNIGPKNPMANPIKQLKNSTIEQLKILCREQRNINFNSKVNLSANTLKQNCIANQTVQMFRKQKKRRKEPASRKLSKSRLKNFSKNILIKNSLFSVYQSE